jgi:hypothetical protein
LHISRVNIESNHATDEIHSNLLFPSFFWTRKCYFNMCRFRGLESQEISWVVNPCEFLWFLFEFTIV